LWNLLARDDPVPGPTPVIKAIFSVILKF
jgi:hypothetical protein